MKPATIVLLVSALIGSASAESIRRNNVSLREGAGAFFPVISTLNAGDRVKVVSREEPWFEVAIPAGEKGWVAAMAFEEQSASIDYGVMAGDWVDRQASRTMVSAAVKGFFENRLNRAGLNLEIMERPVRAYFSPPGYLSFRAATYRDTWSPERFRRRYRLKRHSGFAIDETLFAISAYTAAILTVPGLIADLPLTAYVNQLAQLVAENTEFYDLPVTVHLVDSEEIYANALPIGVIVISKGMLKQLESEHELVCLIAHEMAHITLGHGETEMGKRRVKFRAESAFAELDELLGFEANELDELADEMYELAIKGRKEEYEAEADARGAVYAYRAGYDPEGLILLMERLEMKIPRHPDPDDIRHWIPYTFRNRIARLQGFVRKELKTGEAYLRNEHRYQRMAERL